MSEKHDKSWKSKWAAPAEKSSQEERSGAEVDKTIPGPAPIGAKIGNYSLEYMQKMAADFLRGDVSMLKGRNDEFKDTIYATALMSIHARLKKLEQDLGQ